MPLNAKKRLLAMLVCLTILATACGQRQGDSEDAIATAVAQTVQAQSRQSTAAVAISQTPSSLPVTPGAVTPTLPPKPTFPPPVGGDSACMKASLVGETIPDGTILKPGQQFTKIWKIQNASTCTWDTSYKIVFWDGDVMGGGYVYNFPQQALPGDIVDVPLVLTAPAEDGNYQSYWKLQTPGGSNFGVGADTAFWADIVVSSSDKVEYGVTAVTYSVDRNPATGCPANVFYTIYATISVNGPATVTYNWRKSDGALENKRTLKFTEAGSETVSMEWSIHLGSATNERWAQIFTIAPTEQDFGKATFTYSCG